MSQIKAAAVHKPRWSWFSQRTLSHVWLFARACVTRQMSKCVFPKYSNDKGAERLLPFFYENIESALGRTAWKNLRHLEVNKLTAFLRRKVSLLFISVDERKAKYPDAVRWKSEFLRRGSESRSVATRSNKWTNSDLLIAMTWDRKPDSSQLTDSSWGPISSRCRPWNIEWHVLVIEKDIRGSGNATGSALDHFLWRLHKETMSTNRFILVANEASTRLGNIPTKKEIRSIYEALLLNSFKFGVPA